MMEKYNYNQILKKFEPELIEEMENLQQMEIPKGQVNPEGNNVNFIPLMLYGKIKVFKKDKEGREATIYDLNPGDSCIVSITAGYRGEKIPIQSLAMENSRFLAVSPEKAKEWFVKYESWRKFVIGLYNNRLQELISENIEVVKQRDEIDYKNNQIMESIRYAQRIQAAVLPPEDLIKRLIPEHFIFYRPRDIVSGDFYWIRQEENKVYLAAADATGHGVPGAFMSMLGMSLMNEISMNFKGNAADFLSVLRAKIKDSLRQSEYESSPKDGMDVSLCIIYPEEKRMEYAGAYNPLLCIRDNELLEYKADKMPIGIHYAEKSQFTNTSIELKENDIYYMFSDGFPDQIGGDRNRKYMRKYFRAFLMKISSLSISEQQKKLNEEFTNWKGENEQVDDVLVFGFRIKKEE